MQKKPWAAKAVLFAAIMTTMFGFMCVYSDLNAHSKLPFLPGDWTVTFCTNDSMNMTESGTSVYAIQVGRSGNTDIFPESGELRSSENGTAGKIHFKEWVIRKDHIEIAYIISGSVLKKGFMRLFVDPQNHGHLTGSFVADIPGENGHVDVMITP